MGGGALNNTCLFPSNKTKMFKCSETKNVQKYFVFFWSRKHNKNSNGIHIILLKKKISDEFQGVSEGANPRGTGGFQITGGS